LGLRKQKWESIHIPIAIITVSFIVHSVVHTTITSCAFGLGFAAFFVLGQSLRERVSYALYIIGTTEAIWLLVDDILRPSTWHGGALEVAHLSAFIITIAIALAPTERLRIALILVGAPSILLSGTEEGIALLVALMVAYVNRTTIIWLASVMLVSFLISLITGHFDATHPNLIDLGERTSSIESVSNGRWHVIANSIDWSLLTGSGWSWHVVASKTVHIVPLLIATQLGIAAAVSWLYLVIKCTKHNIGAMLVILTASFVDHYLWTFLFIETPIILGSVWQSRPQR